MSKTAAAPETRQFLGRPGNGVAMGVVGMPNVGKSTMFNILSSLNVPAENYPFCTIDPNTAKVPVPDERFDYLCDNFKPKSEVAAVLTVTDIAGLVKGANEGKGLGNAFLSHISAVDAIYHVVRAFKDTEIEHVEGSVDPIRDMEIISEELILKDLQRCRDKVEGLRKVVERGIDKSKKVDLAAMQTALKLLEDKKDIRSHKWPSAEIDIITEMQFLSAKPVCYLVNIGKDEFIKMQNKWVKKIMDWVKVRDPFAKVIPFSASFENDLISMEPEARKNFLAENKTMSMVPKIITTGYHTLDLIHYFTCGPDEVRAWTIRRGTTAPAAAAVIHTDFQKFFVCADVMSYNDFKQYGSEAAVKAAGKYKTQGKLYEVVDGDIIYFKHNAGSASKK